MHYPRILPILLSTLLVSACSESPSESIQTVLENLNPCELLTAHDIQQVTGHAMNPGEERHDFSCNFASVEVQGQYKLPKYRWFLQYMRNSAASPQEIKEHQKAMMAEVDGYQSTPVSGIGDQAYWDRFSGVTVLTVYKTQDTYTHTLSIQPDFKGEEQVLDQAKALANLALQRLN